MKAAVLLTCFNRKDRTLSCLESIHNQLPVVGLELIIYLVDDGSVDGTGQAVADTFPNVRILGGDGSLYWNGGMNVAWRAAREQGYDYYIWINDDVTLRPGGFQDMFACLRKVSVERAIEPVIVGSFCDGETGAHAYGGFKVKKTPWGIKTKRVLPNGRLTECDTFNGNFVLVPASVVESVGILDNRYTHSFGDKDYGIRCMKEKIPMYITPDYVGVCSRNNITGTWMDPSVPLRERHRKLLLPTGLPPGEYFYSYRKHSGSLAGLIAVLKVYVRLMFPGVWARLSKRESGE